jgi:hypothetical protein
MSKKKPAIKKSIKKPIKKVTKKVTKKVINKVIKKVAARKPAPKPVVSPRPKENIIEGKDTTDIQILESFLGGNNKVKLWKVFLLNANRDFLLKDLVKLTKIKSDNLILELRDLMKLGLIKASRKEKIISYRTNKSFPLISEITEMVLSVIPRSVEKILEKLNTLSRLKTVLLSGFFTGEMGHQKSLSNSLYSNIDLLLVFEKVPNNVDVVISELEYSIGKELTYCALDQNDFRYRHSIGDKLIRDVLDFDHIVAMDKLSFFR